MAVNYLEILGEYYPTAEAFTVGDPGVYGDIQWVTAAISQAELDAVYLVDYKTQKILYFSELATEDVVNGFDSSAIGAPHKYDSLPEDQLNLIGSVATGIDMYYACRAYLQGYQIVNIGGAVVGTDATGFANTTALHDAEVVVDGTSVYLSIEGQNAQTYDALLTEINNDADFSAVATATLEGGNIKITSNTYGASSTISILDADCFNMLTAYVGINAAVPGEDPSDSTKEYRWHTNAQLIQVTQDGAIVKLTTLQKFNVKKQQIINAVDVAAVDAIVW